MTFFEQDRVRRAGRPGAFPPLPDPVRDFGIAAVLGFLGLTALHGIVFGHVSAAAWVPALALFAVGAAVAAALLERHYPHPLLGWCNVVTLGRGALAAFLVTPLLVGSPHPWLVAGLALATLLLDAADGWLARRRGLVSDFGGRFDVEVDSAFALILALHAVASGLAWPLALVLGTIRYGFVLAAAALPWLRRPLPERVGRKAVCVLQLATLIAVQVPVVTPALATALAGVAALMLVLSFGRDVLWLWRRRG